MIVISTLRVGDIRLRRVISILTEWVIYFPAENVKEDASRLVPLRSITLGLRPSLYKGACEALIMPTAGPDIFANGKYIIHHIATQYIIRQRRTSLS